MPNTQTNVQVIDEVSIRYSHGGILCFQAVRYCYPDNSYEDGFRFSWRDGTTGNLMPLRGQTTLPDLRAARLLMAMAKDRTAFRNHPGADADELSRRLLSSLLCEGRGIQLTTCLEPWFMPRETLRYTPSGIARFGLFPANIELCRRARRQSAKGRVSRASHRSAQVRKMTVLRWLRPPRFSELAVRLRFPKQIWLSYRVIELTFSLRLPCPLAPSSDWPRVQPSPGPAQGCPGKFE